MQNKELCILCNLTFFGSRNVVTTYSLKSVMFSLVHIALCCTSWKWEWLFRTTTTAWQGIFYQCKCCVSDILTQFRQEVCKTLHSRLSDIEISHFLSARFSAQRCPLSVALSRTLSEWTCRPRRWLSYQVHMVDRHYGADQWSKSEFC
jgi:hypothetical protein